MSTKPAVARAVKNYRARIRADGLWPLQIWVPDTRAPGFVADARRQSRLVGRSPESREAQNWINRNRPLAVDE
jgi:hypothetical protein